MKTTRIMALAVLIVGGGLALHVAHARAKSANGIAFSEFRGYDAWQVIAMSQPDTAGRCGTSKDASMKVILGSPIMIKAYCDGIPANGKPVPDGAAMAKIEWAQIRNTASPYAVTVPGPQREVSFMLKDAER